MARHPYRPAPVAPGIRSLHVGVPILLPNQTYPIEREQPAIAPSAPTFWSPYQFTEPVPLRGRPCIGTAKWSPPSLWDVAGLSNVYERWPNQGSQPVQGPLTKVSFGSWLSRYRNLGGVLRPTPTIPMPQPTITAGYGLMGGIRS